MILINGSTPNQGGMFKFYIDGVETSHRFPLFKTRDNGVTVAFLKGVTVNTTGNKMNVAPVYKPLFIFDKRPGALRVEMLGIRLMLLRRLPLIYLERVTPKGDPDE